MVLWELTVITAYFLGLKRTYRLAIRLQRRLVGPNHPRIRQFLYRRTRNVFDVAVKVHKNIQQRDIEVGRNLGNWILRWLHRMKPSAQIRPPAPEVPTSTSNKLEHVASSSKLPGVKEANVNSKTSNGQVLFSPLNIRSKYFPTMSMMLQPRNSANWNHQHRHITYSTPYVSSFQRRRVLAGVLRDDIAQWMLHQQEAAPVFLAPLACPVDGGLAPVLKSLVPGA